MIKKIFVGLLITVVFGAAVFGVASQTFAKGGRSDNGQVAQSETEPGVPNLYQYENQNEYLYSYQNGDCAEGEAVCTREMTATQSQTAQQQGPFGGTDTQNGPQGDGICNQNCDDETCEPKLLQDGTGKPSWAGVGSARKGGK